MTQEQDPRPAIADQLRFAAKNGRQARDFLNVLIGAGEYQLSETAQDVAIILALAPILTAAMTRLAKSLEPKPQRRRGRAK